MRAGWPTTNDRAGMDSPRDSETPAESGFVAAQGSPHTFGRYRRCSRCSSASRRVRRGCRGCYRVLPAPAADEAIDGDQDDRAHQRHDNTRDVDAAHQVHAKEEAG